VHDITVEGTIAEAAHSPYDFRRSACPADPLQHLFSEWVPYYRLKWAIARALQPATILEIGVRFGYSALAFLDACPSASYFGIDADCEAYGGSRGAINWAKERARGSKAEFLIADSQKMSSFPGGSYDLIHIDGQQDGKGTLHDLDLALGQGRYILVDGYFWTRENFLAASEFVYRYRDLIEYCVVIPGYAGELLIKPRSQQGPAAGCNSSEDVRPAYIEDYYLRDCGGFDSAKRTGGVRIEDPRLAAVATIAATAKVGRALDLGCGRGEVSVFLAGLGHDVLAVDYSSEAIALSTRTRSLVGSLASRIELRCQDVNETPLSGHYDVAVASDLIEHMAPEELDRLYARVADHLHPKGLFVVHTFPNAWFYRYEYPRRLRIAQSVGAYLPSEPRSRWELLMHINEQRPQVLRRQISRYFPHVKLWFTGHSLASPVENLLRGFRIPELRAAGDLFAVASHSELDVARLIEAFTTEPIPFTAAIELRMGVAGAPSRVLTGESFSVVVRIDNPTDFNLKSHGQFPVHLSYHWLEASGRTCVVFEGVRSCIPFLPRHGTRISCMSVTAPEQPGNYILQATLVQERVAWYCDMAVPVEVLVPVVVG
jgi:SAM-dependent methyltransferase